MKKQPLTQTEFLKSENPFVLFSSWLKLAETTEINDPNAMCLATLDKAQMPNIRMVLLKHVDENGFVFYTNFESQKGQEILAHEKVALCFHWKSLRKQVRIRGMAHKVSEEEADEYFASRPRGSQIGAWASKQSRPLESRFALEKAVLRLSKSYLVGKIDRPSYWSGFRVKPLEIEFWQDKPFRLHDRLVFRRETFDKPWTKTMLYP